MLCRHWNFVNMRSLADGEMRHFLYCCRIILLQLLPLPCWHPQQGYLQVSAPISSFFLL